MDNSLKLIFGDYSKITKLTKLMTLILLSGAIQMLKRSIKIIAERKQVIRAQNSNGQNSSMPQARTYSTNGRQRV